MEVTGQGKKILIVDDKDENRRLLKKILSFHSFTVIETATGESAIDLALDQKPDLILMDIRLREGIDGIEATRRIKANSATSHIPIVAITASVGPEDMQKALDNGCSGFIRKPIDINEFPDQIKRYLVKP
jgi:two-component system, cell cycle response regulator DivK